MRVKLTPGEGAEIKLRMQAGDKAEYHWVVEGGMVNFDTHGDGGGRSISYEKGRGVPQDEGELVAATRMHFTLRRQDARAGTVHVHFPRVGYVMRALA